MKTSRMTYLGAVFLAACLLCGCASRTPVLSAAEEGDLRKLKAALKSGHSINEHDPHVKFGWTPLIAAIYQNNTDVVNFLITAGADLDLGDNQGETPLMWAASRGDEDVDIVQDLIAHGANVLATNKNGASVLEFAESAPPKPKVLELVRAAARREQARTGRAPK